MIIKTPALAVKTVTVFPALFKAQLPDTLKAIRGAIPDWSAVHVVAQAGPGKNAPTKEQMRDELLAQLKPKADLYDPIWPLTTPEIPANAVATFVKPLSLIQRTTLVTPARIASSLARI